MVQEVWKRREAVEIVLFLLDGKPRSQKQISEETGCWQGRISEILHKLRDENFVFNPNPTISHLPTRGKPVELWALNQKTVERIFTRIIFHKNPHFARGSSTSVRMYKKLPKLVMQYLRLVAGSPRWRSIKWFENHIDELYPWQSKKEKKEQLQSGKANIPSMRPTEFNLQGLAEQFIEYLLVNRKTKKLKNKQVQEEIMRLMESYHLSNESRDLRDVELDPVKPRLITADKKQGTR